MPHRQYHKPTWPLERAEYTSKVPLRWSDSACPRKNPGLADRRRQEKSLSAMRTSPCTSHWEQGKWKLLRGHLHRSDEALQKRMCYLPSRGHLQINHAFLALRFYWGPHPQNPQCHQRSELLHHQNNPQPYIVPRRCPRHLLFSLTLTKRFVRRHRVLEAPVPLVPLECHHHRRPFRRCSSLDAAAIACQA